MDATYRADLRELNELNFARFDAKLDQRLAELRAELRVQGAEIRRGMADLRAELLRWAFLFWVTTLGALYALTR